MAKKVAKKVSKKTIKQEQVDKVSQETGVSPESLDRLNQDALTKLDDIVPDEDEAEVEEDALEEETNVPAKVEKEEEPKKVAKKAVAKNPKELVRVFSQVNMTCLDGTRLIAGEFAEISKAEYERLKKDKRKEFFKE